MTAAMLIVRAGSPAQEIGDYNVLDPRPSPVRAAANASGPTSSTLSTGPFIDRHGANGFDPAVPGIVRRAQITAGLKPSGRSSEIAAVTVVSNSINTWAVARGCIAATAAGRDRC